MPSMTDYMVLSDGSFDVTGTFPGPAQKVLTFTLPGDFTIGTKFARPLLAYIVNFRSSEGSVGVWVNPELPLKESQREQTLTWKNPNRADSGLWEAIDGTKFKPGEENKIFFAIQSAEKGDVTFRDVVLWLQRGSGA